MNGEVGTDGTYDFADILWRWVQRTGIHMYMYYKINYSCYLDSLTFTNLLCVLYFCEPRCNLQSHDDRGHEWEKLWSMWIDEKLWRIFNDFPRDGLGRKGSTCERFSLYSFLIAEEENARLAQPHDPIVKYL